MPCTEPCIVMAMFVIVPWQYAVLVAIVAPLWMACVVSRHKLEVDVHVHLFNSAENILKPNAPATLYLAGVVAELSAKPGASELISSFSTFCRNHITYVSFGGCSFLLWRRGCSRWQTICVEFELGSVRYFPHHE